MRSRYSAFHLDETAYLLESWHASYRPAEFTPDSRISWIGLEIIEFIPGEKESNVEFEACFIFDGKVQAMREYSYFVREQAQWFYTRGEERMAKLKPWKPSRNQQCPCGSGEKFKRCCFNV